MAQLLGVTPQAISKWIKRRPPAGRCMAIEEATARKVRCEHLRPDVQWQRDGRGRVTGYLVKVGKAA